MTKLKEFDPLVHIDVREPLINEDDQNIDEIADETVVGEDG